MLKEALLCLSLTIYFEARGEPDIGQYAVAEVVVNRAKESSICEVVAKPNQFSWYKRWNKKVPQGTSWTKSVTIAEIILNGQPTNYTNGAIYFRHKSIKGKVASPIVIGNHIFYH